MQKREKMDARMSGVVRVPVMEERWWRVARRSWAMRSPGRPVRSPWRMAEVEDAASRSAWAWRMLVTRMVSSSVEPRKLSAMEVKVASRSWWPSPVFVEKLMEDTTRGCGFPEPLESPESSELPDLPE